MVFLGLSFCGCDIDFVVCFGVCLLVICVAGAFGGWVFRWVCGLAWRFPGVFILGFWVLVFGLQFDGSCGWVCRLVRWCFLGFVWFVLGRVVFREWCGLGVLCVCLLVGVI